jgi:hypothetical protein
MATRHRFCPLAAGLLAGAVLALLSVGPALAAEPHACDYLTAAEAAQATGLQFAPPQRRPANPLGQSICFFDPAPEAGMRFVQLQLVTSDSPRLRDKGFTAESLYDNNTGFLSDPRPVEGLGEKAVWGGSGMKMGAGLHVYARDAYFVVLSQAGGDAASLSQSRALAERVLAKLK